jgi:cysteine-rich repeat protein
MPGCGDGVVDTGERCDNGPANSDTQPDACRTDCTAPRCGDSVVDSGESCDNGPLNSDSVPDACRTDCASAGCGDGVIDTGEGCDDGNDVGGDGCSAVCLFEPIAPTIGDDTCVTGPNTGEPCGTNDDCSGGVCGLKSRYITILPSNPGVAGGSPTSIQVTVRTMPQYPEHEGEVYWVGPEIDVPNSPNATLRGAALRCEASPSNAQIWTAGDLHLFGLAIIPGSDYEVRHCSVSGDLCSEALVVATGKWGDIIAMFGGSTQPNFADVAVVVDKFRNLVSAPDMPRVDLVGVGGPGQTNMPNQTANFSDIAADVDAFRGFAFPFTVSACPP